MDRNEENNYEEERGFDYDLENIENEEDYPYIILGTPFLREYYTIFDEEENVIGLGKNKILMLSYTYSYFWYYTLIILVFFWAIVMISKKI